MRSLSSAEAPLSHRVQAGRKNQRVPKANLWFINYCILDMKADIMNLQLVYRHILSLSKNENMSYETETKNKTNKRTKKNFSIGRSNTGPPMC